MFLSAFLFYTRSAVVCKNFSDFNSHHFLIPAAHIFQERSVSLRGSINNQYIPAEASDFSRKVSEPLESP